MMERRIVIESLVRWVAASTLWLLLPLTPVHGQWVVGSDGNLNSISEAIALASEGDTVEVASGIYFEHDLVIDKSISIIGTDGAVIDGEGKGTLIVIRADGVTIEGLTLRNTGFSHVYDHAAILIEEVADPKILNNRLENIFFGIYLAETQGGEIRGNSIQSDEHREAASGNGIHLWNSTGPTVVGNHIQGQRDGIYLEFVTDAEIRENTSVGNNRYGLHFMFSNDCRYVGNEFRRNGAGVAVMYSSRVEMVENRFLENWGGSSYGLLLKDMTESLVARNEFFKNTTAIFSEGSSKMDVRDNRFELNGWAIKIRSNSRDNRFTGNLFIENTFDVGTDSRRNPNLFEQNYWSHYDGYDLDRDGIGDVPYRPVRLFSMMIDRYPSSMILLRSLLISILDAAEQVFPVLTPADLVDEMPKMNRNDD